MIRRMTIGLLIAGSALISLLPLLWLVGACLRDPDNFFGPLLFPSISDWQLSSFERLFAHIDFFRFTLNSLFATSVTTLIQLACATMGGYALAVYEFRGKRIVIGLMLATLLIPGTVLLAPSYELLYHLGMIDSYQGLILPASISVFGMFLFQQNFKQVPGDLLLAAKVDGCGDVATFWHIGLPLVRPMVGAFCLMTFMSTWNGFLWPQIILQSDHLFTLPIGLSMLRGIHQTEHAALMAGTFLAIVPVVILFFLLQKDFVAGLTDGAVKG